LVRPREFSSKFRSTCGDKEKEREKEKEMELNSANRYATLSFIVWTESDKYNK